MANENVLAVNLSDIPGASSGSDTDYLTAICIHKDENGNCTSYQHERDTPTSDQESSEGS